MNDFITREEIYELYKDMPEDEAKRTGDAHFELLYKDDENYEKHFAEYQTKQGEAEELRNFIAIDEEGLSEREQSLETLEVIQDPEACHAFEFEKRELLDKGVPLAEAEKMAKSFVLMRYGEQAFKAPENDPLDAKIALLEESGLMLSPTEKAKVKSKMRIYGLKPLEAVRKVAEELGVKEYDEQKQQSSGDRYYDALSPSDRTALAGLRASQPDSKWSAKKLYLSIHGKALPKPAPATPEPTVSREKYEQEHTRYMKIRRKFLDMGLDPDNLPDDAA